MPFPTHQRMVNFRSHFVGPVATMVAAAIVALIGGLLWLTEIQNEEEAASEQIRVAEAFKDRVNSVESNVHIFAQWDEAALKLAVDLDPAWADVNESRYLYDQFGYEHVFIVDATGRPLYASTRGVRSQADPRRLIASAYWPALAKAGSTPTPRAVGGVSRSLEGPVIFGISRLRGHTEEVDRSVQYRRFVVTTKLVDAAVIEQVSLLSRGPGLVHYSPKMRTGAGTWALPAIEGGTTGALYWEPDFSGTGLRESVFPWLCLLIVLMIGLAGRVLLRARDALRLAQANQVRANYLAGHDALTGLPNRRSFLAHLEDIRLGGAEYVLFFLDLDGFKEVNDTFGHAAGDALLRKTAQRLRESRPEKAYVARLGGDEFAVVIDHDMAREGLGPMASRLAKIVQEPHEFGGAPTVVGVSIGIAVSNHDEHENVIRKADTAMYAAKVERRNGWKIYSADIAQNEFDRKEMENDLRCALKNREISLVYQPIRRTHDGRITAMEALARWTHPRKGAISPDVFIPIAEQTGLIVELGKHILRTACEDARNWPFKLNVNLSPAQFWDRGLVGGVIAILKETDFPASRLEFEITETYLNRRTEAAARIVARLRKIGTTISLDDFGAGYASIAYLRAFEFDLVKIDRSIVERCGTDEDAAEMLVAIVALCNALKLPCLAEGVETEAQALSCVAAGCQYIQGWYVGMPVPAVEVAFGLEPSNSAAGRRLVTTAPPTEGTSWAA